MTKAFSTLATALALALALMFVAASQAKADTWTGWISDENCGAKGMSADHKSCALKCVKGGAKYAFVNSENKEVIPIDNQDAVKESDLGQEVKVTGSLTDNKSLHIESIGPAK